MRSDWTDTQTRTLIDDWLAGRSAKEIAERINKTANAVIGKTNRLYLPQRANVTAAKRRKPAARQPGQKAHAPSDSGHPQETPRLSTVPSSDIALGSGFCCWPMWGSHEKISHLYCHQPVRLGSSYCPRHHTQGHLSRIPAYLRVGGKGKSTAG